MSLSAIFSVVSSCNYLNSTTKWKTRRFTLETSVTSMDSDELVDLMEFGITNSWQHEVIEQDIDTQSEQRHASHLFPKPNDDCNNVKSEVK